jgi:hypothetical protein
VKNKNSAEYEHQTMSTHEEAVCRKLRDSEAVEMLTDSNNKESPPRKIMPNHKRNYQNSSDNSIKMLRISFSAVFKGAQACFTCYNAENFILKHLKFLAHKNLQ